MGPGEALAACASGRARGMTLVELLAALVLSALVLALAARILLTGHREFLARVFESDRLSAMVRLKATVQQALEGEIDRCGGGRLVLKREGPQADLAAWVKQRFPGADSISFRCYEADARGGLAEWKDRFQPQLVEYGITLRSRGRADRLEGSFLK